MENNTDKKTEDQQPENIKDLKDQTVKKDEVKKGYNEKTEVQPEGSFRPDSTTDDN